MLGFCGLFCEIWIVIVKFNLLDIVIFELFVVDYYFEYLIESNLLEIVFWERIFGYSVRVIGYFVLF